jgi:protein pelota
MKILKISDSSCRIRVDDQDDLWVLAQVCRKGIQIGMLGHRRDSTTGSKEGERAKEAERKTMWIVLQIEQSEYHAFSESLRTTGIILEAPIDQGFHHTHSIEIHSEIELNWQDMIPIDDRELLKKSADAGSKTKVLLIVVENDEIQLFEVTANGLKEGTQFNLRGGGKREGDSAATRDSFFEKTAKETLHVVRPGMPILLCGPGSARERFASALKNAGCNETIRTVSTSIGGRAAANEVLREELADDILGEHTIVRQTRLIEDALTRIGTDGAVAYGALEILNAAEQGAIDTLIINAEMLRDETKLCINKQWSTISELVLTSGGEVEQSSTNHDAGVQLLGFGGAIALLRWKIE